MTDLKAWNLVADIGGTNARFAVHDKSSDDIKSIIVLSVEKYPYFLTALKDFIEHKWGKDGLKRIMGYLDIK